MKKETMRVEYYSRYGDLRVCTKVNENQYLLEGKSRFLRYSGNQMIDLAGGPCIYLGDKIGMYFFDEEDKSDDEKDSDDDRRISKMQNISDEEGYAKILLTVS